MEEEPRRAAGLLRVSLGPDCRERGEGRSWRGQRTRTRRSLTIQFSRHSRSVAAVEMRAQPWEAG
ncbi:hypothetical protein GCM10028787_05270 [Brachybacterium horti]